MTPSIVDIARTLATKAHEGQTRRGGAPYIAHPEAVAAWLAERGESDEVIAVALLHDTIEDSQLGTNDLRAAGLPESVAHAVWLLTKQKDEFYVEYLVAIKTNPLARTVKIADMLHNLSDAPSERAVKKYANGLLYLLGNAS